MAESRDEMDVRELLAQHAAMGGWEVLEPEKLVLFGDEEARDGGGGADDHGVAQCARKKNEH